MPIIGEMRLFISSMQRYLLGKGLLTLGVLATTMIASAMGFGFVLPSLVMAGGGIALNGFLRLGAQADYEQQMTDLYREDIALALGKNPNEITRADLKEAAKDNEVIEQALTRQRRKNWVSFATSALAAVATFGILNFALSPTSVGNALVGFFDDYFGNAANMLRFASVGVVSGFSSLILHNGLEAAIGHGTGLSKAAAHDLIVRMDYDVKHGRSVTPEQVYGVTVAENIELQRSIETRFGEAYHNMNAREQAMVIGSLGLVDDMKEMAGYINAKEVPPGRLAYLMHFARTEKTSKAAEPALEAREPARAPFVERLGLAPREGLSHTERVNAGRNNDLALAGVSHGR